MTKDELVQALVQFAAEVKADRTMGHGDVDHVARLLAYQRNIAAVAVRKRKEEGPAPMRPLGGKPRGSVPEGKIGRNMSTPESRVFWESCDEGAREVATWPEWKRSW